MDFGSLVNKAKESATGNDEKASASELQSAEEAYKTFNRTEGTYQEKATAAFSEYQKMQGSGDKLDAAIDGEQKQGAKDCSIDIATDANTDA